MLTIKSSVFLKKLQRFFSVLETACQAGHAAPPFSLPSAVGIPSADTAARRWRREWPSRAGDVRHGMAWGLPPPGGGGKRGRDTKVSLPLLTPQPFLWTRLPSVARLKARGPQGRLVLQGYTIDRSGAFRSGTPPPCTVWPRTVMRGKSRKVNSGHNSVL